MISFLSKRLSRDKMWSPGKGNVKPLQHSFLENPMNSIKRWRKEGLSNSKEDTDKSEDQADKRAAQGEEGSSRYIHTELRQNPIASDNQALFVLPLLTCPFSC